MSALTQTRPLVIFDLETTGTSTDSDRIVEIGLLKVHPDGFFKEKVRRLNPGVPIPAEATEVHDIRDEDVRAIALALEALKKVDRYGVTKRGEQYTGWKQLPGAGRTQPGAEEVLARFSGFSVEQVRNGSGRAAYLEAAKRTHPDAGGNASDFHSVARAAKALGLR